MHRFVILLAALALPLAGCGGTKVGVGEPPANDNNNWNEMNWNEGQWQ